MASVLLGLLTLCCFAAAALGWSTLMGGRWTILSGIAVLTTFVVLLSQGYFRISMAGDGIVRLRFVCAAVAIGVIAAMTVVSLPGLDQPNVGGFVGLMSSLFVAAIVGRLGGHWLLKRLWRAGHLRATALILGTDDLARQLAVEVEVFPQYGVDVVGYISENLVDDQPGPTPVTSVTADNGTDRTNGAGTSTHQGPTVIPAVHALEELAAVVADHGADRLIIGPAAALDDRYAQRVARWAASLGLSVHIVPRFYQMGLGLDSMSPDLARGYPLIRLQRSAHPQLSIRLKRLLDVVTAGTALVVLAPVLAAAAVAVKLSSPGPVLFSQERVGRHGRTITIRKFRSMHVSEEADTEWDADARVTTVGRWLRRLNIDELPQLLTILSGDMSLVGPRPERPVFVDRFRMQIPDYDDRHRVPAGLTGLAQVVGLRGNTSIAERVKYDNLYIDQWSLRADLQILARTVVAVVFQQTRAQQMIDLERALEAAPPSLTGQDR
ncbi:MAG: exopolysaccharide biosynthesis polyprenyl glycosylphosphotransferase [Actinomycetota bacterium]